MGILDKIGRAVAGGVTALKDFGVTVEGDAGWYGLNGGSATRFAGTDVNWAQEAGDLSLNAVVSICAQYITNKITVPDVNVVYQNADTTLTPIVKHPCSELIRWANPEYRGRQLISALALSFKLNGNAYAVKVRGAGIGLPRELWYVPYWQMEPVTPKDGGPTQFYKHIYRTPSGAVAWEMIARENVVHFRNGLDPHNPRKGMAPFLALLRSVASDNEIDSYTAVIMRNVGVSGAVISPSGKGADGTSDEITPEQAQELKRRMLQSMTGDSRGQLIVSNVPVESQFVTRSPEELALDKIGDRPQARICAAFGIDPSAVGLASVKGEKYGALRKEARESSYEACIMPTLAVFAEGWTQDLLPDFAANALRSDWVEYDYSRVSDLQEDADAVHVRAQGDFQKGIATLDEARSLVGLKPAVDPDLGERFYWQLTPAPTGEFGVPGTAYDPADPEGTPPAKEDEDLPDEDDEDDE